jgi:hypothetical protein
MLNTSVGGDNDGSGYQVSRVMDTRCDYQTLAQV